MVIQRIDLFFIPTTLLFYASREVEKGDMTLFKMYTVYKRGFGQGSKYRAEKFHF